MDILERVWQRATKMTNTLEYLSYAERLRAGTTHPGEEKGQGGFSSMYTNA